jgi:hypothetical protein
MPANIISHPVQRNKIISHGNPSRHHPVQRNKNTRKLLYMEPRIHHPVQHNKLLYMEPQLKTKGGVFGGGGAEGGWGMSLDGSQARSA